MGERQVTTNRRFNGAAAMGVATKAAGTALAGAATSVRGKASPTGSKVRVVYVAGSGHTGSTLLAMLLDSHPAIVSVGEIAVKPKIRRRGDDGRQHCSCGATIADCGFWQRLFRRVREDGFDLGPGRWTNDYRSEQRWLRRLFAHDSAYRPVRRFQQWAADHLPVHAATLRQTDRVNVSFMRAALEVAGAQVFCDTTKQSMRMRRLLRIPELDVKVITLVRDVRGYVASAKRRGHSVRHAASTWLADQELIGEMTRSMPDDRRFLLKYEDLCGDLIPTLQRLYAFCGVEDFNPGTVVTSKNHHVLGNSMRLRGSIHVRLDETWRAALTQQEQDDILAISGRLNRSFGYV